MIQKIYYAISTLFYKCIIKEIGRNVHLRLSGRIINGNYVKIGSNVTISEKWLIAVYPDYGNIDNPVKTNQKGVVIEEGVSVNRNMTIYCADSVKIGANCMLGSNILITDNDHGMNPESVSYSDQPLITKETIIEDGCWIAQNCMILAGSHIGKRAIIGAGSVVKGNIPAYCIAVGCPAKVIREWDFEKHMWRKV